MTLNFENLASNLRDVVSLSPERDSVPPGATPSIAFISSTDPPAGSQREFQPIRSDIALNSLFEGTRVGLDKPVRHYEKWKFLPNETEASIGASFHLPASAHRSLRGIADPQEPGLRQQTDVSAVCGVRPPRVWSAPLSGHIVSY